MKEQIISIIATVLKVDKNRISADTSINDMEEWDSLATLMIMEALEVEFKKSIPLDKIINMEKVTELITFIEG